MDLRQVFCFADSSLLIIFIFDIVIPGERNPFNIVYMFLSGKLAPTHKKTLARWRLELARLVNGKGDFTEDEEIFSPETASSCSSRDTGLGSVSELLSDDDQNPVTSVNLESVTSHVKEQSGKTSCCCFRAVFLKLWSSIEILYCDRYLEITLLLLRQFFSKIRTNVVTM